MGRNETSNSTYVLLKVKNILRKNEIDYSDVEFVENVPNSKILRKDDIITPFIGEAIKQIKFSSFNKEGVYSVDNNVGVIRVNSKIANPIFVCEYLNSILGKIQLNRLIGGGGVPFLGTQAAKRLQVNLPLSSKQSEIAKYISEIRTHANALQNDAKNILEEAKREVEKMILGE